MSLYRKYRPKIFDEVIGQPHITATLINQIKYGTVGHAYLFTGSRGTGKTTCAKIFSLAINCESPNNGSPCFKCPACIMLTTPGDINILEIDAASNNGVDQIRELREQVNYLPVGCKYKVYIVDEVHMLSGEAFNALLKTLEEPPSHVVFVLATTEIHRLPATILSRCMRFDFRLVASDIIETLLIKVLDQLKKQYEPDAIKYIARAGEGSVRDALSLLDLCSGSKDKLTYEGVLLMLGAGGVERISGLFDAVTTGDLAKILETINLLISEGLSAVQLIREFLGYARDVLVVKTVKAYDKILILTAEQTTALNLSAKNADTQTVAVIMDVFAKADTEVRTSISPRLQLEAACLRAAKLIGADNTHTIAETTKKKDDLRQKIGSLSATEAQKVWGKLIIHLRKNAPLAIFNALSLCRNYSFENNVCRIITSNSDNSEINTPETKELIQKGLKEQSYDIGVEVELQQDNDYMDKTISKIKDIAGNTKVNISE
ncbi:MAG: DNA polymerase III subunit gamma/tau [Firmicutes bacterium]|nr:DNA polymerase III subunit gamma/tau [Bacillota bacterium]